MASEVVGRPASSVDAFYTPAALAQELAEAMPNDLRGRVFDPTVGEGALLAAVGARFGDSVQLLGLDLDERVVRAVRRREPNWVLGRADATRPQSRRSSLAWRLATEDLSAVVLNPPFSYRGNGGQTVTYGGFNGRVAPSMHFLVEVLRMLRPRHGVYAIMPDGALDADRHRALWEEIVKSHSLTRMRRLSNSSFRGARVSTTLVQLRPRADLEGPLAIAPDTGRTCRRLDGGCRCVELIRGRVPVHRVPLLNASEVSPFLHTTNLRAGTPTMSAPTSLSDEGPMVIINRIGRFRDPTVLNLGRVVLSDCLFALRPRARSQVEQLHSEVRSAAQVFASEYRGTGAKYVTVGSILRQLSQLDWHAHQVVAGASVSPCCCGASESLDCEGTYPG